MTPVTLKHASISDGPLAAIAIGRNEGTRLIDCLDSLQGQVARIIYVDSGSTDGSQEAAKARGAEVIPLDMSQPFTAARARNAGLDHLATTGTTPAFVQFLDGDCALQPDWIDAARTFLDAHPNVAIVCGRRRERFPEASQWNRLIDAEWDTPIGEAKYCGGDALMRFNVLRDIGGYNPDLIAGEEPEMCVRVRASGWHIWRLDAEMTLHDAALSKASQWWNRTKRAGYAYAEGAALHGAPPEHHWVRERNRLALWGLFLPAATLVAFLVKPWLGLIFLLIWPAQIARLYLKNRDLPMTLTLVLGKVAEGQGALTYYWRRIRGSRKRLIEYK